MYGLARIRPAWACRLPSLFAHSWSERISRLFSGVRSSCDMLARNSDLYLRGERELLRLVLERLPRLLHLAVLASPPPGSGARAAAPFPAAPGSSAAALPAGCRSSWASDWDCFSRSSVRVLASIVLITMPILSMSCSRNAWCVWLKPSNDASSITAFHLSLEHDRQHEQVARRRGAQPGADAHVVRRHVREQDLLLGDRALPEQALAQVEALAVLARGRPTRSSPAARAAPAPCSSRARRRRRAAPRPRARARTGSARPPCSAPSAPAACG